MITPAWTRLIKGRLPLAAPSFAAATNVFPTTWWNRNWVHTVVGGLGLITAAGVTISKSSAYCDKAGSPPGVLSEAEINRRLAEHETGVVIKDSESPVKAYYTSSIAANIKIEDRHSEQRYKDNKGRWRFSFGIYDGHGGDAAAQFCAEEMLGLIKLRLDSIDHVWANLHKHIDNQKLSASALDEKSKDLITCALTRGFHDTDRCFHCEKFLVEQNIEKVYAGACTIVAHIQNDNLFVANAGDCRAVVGSKVGSKLKAVAMSDDHNASSNRKEVTRLTNEHPKDPGVV
eukprot:Colp12_sorted_trinity150504_noHs@24860